MAKLYSDEVFPLLSPIKWNFGDTVYYSIKGSMGAKTSYKIHNLKDSINEKKNFMDKVLIEYFVNGNSHHLYTVRDLVNPNMSFSHDSLTNIKGDILERITRRRFKHYLRHNDAGRVAPLFGKDFNKDYRDHYIVKSNDEYVLKIKNYPNLVLLKDTKDENIGKHGYIEIKELDGLFDFRSRNGRVYKRNLIVVEVKSRNLDIKIKSFKNKTTKQVLKRNLFEPLKELFPDSDFYYLLVSAKNTLFQKSNNFRALNDEPIKIFKYLKSIGVKSLFATYDESNEDLNTMVEHLYTQHSLLEEKIHEMNVTMTLDDKVLILKNKGETPFMKLKKIGQDTWKEIS